MRSRIIVLGCAVLMLAAAVPIAAGEPREARIAASPGKPSRLALLSSWVTPDPANNGLAAAVFDSSKEMKVLVNATTASSKRWIWSLEVRDESGNVVFSDAYDHYPSPGPSYFGSFRIGPLSAGLYLLKPKIKQGKKKVGMRYWIQVQ